MAGFAGIVKDTVKLGASKAAQGAKYVADTSSKLATKLSTGLYGKVSQVGAGLEARALNSGTTSNIGRIIRTNADEAINNITNKAVSSVAEGAGEQVGKELTKKVSSGIGKNAFIGGAVGSITGAGIGGLTGMATGADDDDMKSMVVMGALAGGAGGAMIGAGSKMLRNKKISGSMFAQSTEALEAAKQMAKEGGKNNAVLDGAKGIFGKAGASAQNFADKIDNVGENIANRFNKDFIDQNSSIRKEIAYQIKKNEGGTSQKALERAKRITDAISSGSYEPEDVMEQMIGNIYNDNITKMRRGNAIGGAAQGALMGSASGALIGGVSGGIDEDETFIGGALKGGFIGGTLGGLAGGASGYFNNSAKVLSNTTSNINSLLGKK